MSIEVTPSPSLVAILNEAYPKCPKHHSVCREHKVEWREKGGHVARGFTGAGGAISEVQLVLILAEPGNPGDGESYNGREANLVRQIATGVANAIRNWEETGSIFHRNLAIILNECWPGLSLEEQLRRTWITESILCSAPVSSGPINKAVGQACGELFLERQLALFPNAFVVCLGRKAEQRLSYIGLEANEWAAAPGKPGGLTKKAQRSWVRVGRLFRRHLASVRRRKESNESGRSPRVD